MRTLQHTAFAIHDGYDILYGGHNTGAGVGVDFYIDMDFASAPRCETCTQPPIEWEPVALSLGVKRPGREADHLTPSSAEVKGVELYPHSPSTPSWRGTRVKYRDNFTFSFTLPKLFGYTLVYTQSNWLSTNKQINEQSL